MGRKNFLEGRNLTDPDSRGSSSWSRGRSIVFNVVHACRINNKTRSVSTNNTLTTYCFCFILMRNQHWVSKMSLFVVKLSRRHQSTFPMSWNLISLVVLLQQTQTWRLVKCIELERNLIMLYLERSNPDLIPLTRQCNIIKKLQFSCSHLENSNRYDYLSKSARPCLL